MIHHFHETDHKVSEGTQRGIDAALATFRDLGAELREVQLSPLQDWAACGSLISMTERAAAYEEWSRTRLGDFSERLRSRLILGALVSGVDYVQAVRRRRELRAELQAAMRGLDVVLTATQPAEAAKIDAAPKWDLFDRPDFTMPFNVAGYRRSRCAQALVTADCRSRSNSSASRSGSRPYSALPTPSRRPPHSAASARRSSPLETVLDEGCRRTRATRLRDLDIGPVLCRPRAATGGA